MACPVPLAMVDGAEAIDSAVCCVRLPSGEVFGWLVFERSSAQPLADCDEAALELLCRDIFHHLKRSEQLFDAVTAESLQSLISEHNQDWIFVKDEQFRIVYGNPAFLTAYPQEKRNRVIGYTTVEEFDAAEAELFLAQDALAFETGISKVVEEIHLPNGSLVTLETTKRRFEDRNGNPYILGICRDITEHVHLIAELRRTNEELGYFTGIASHDLKSPLTAIRRLLEWVLEDCASLLPEEHVENMHLVMDRAKRMQSLLDDLLLYSNLASVDDTVQEVNVRDTVLDIVDLQDTPANLDVTAPDATVVVPVVPFRTILHNLINNAIKYNDQAQVEIQVTVQDEPDRYVFSVRDNGPGIPPQYFERVLQPFQKLQSRDDVEGSGIGLSVVKRLVERVSGELRIESDGVRGCSFEFSVAKVRDIR